MRALSSSHRRTGSAAARVIWPLLGLLLVGSSVAALFLLSQSDEELMTLAGGEGASRETSVRSGAVPFTPSATAPSPVSARSSSPSGSLTLDGSVMDPGGAPLSGARVALIPFQSKAVGPRSPENIVSTALDGLGRRKDFPWPSSTTGSQGKFQLVSLAPAIYLLLVVHSEYRDHVERLDLTSSGFRRVYLTAGLSVAGKVLSPDGKGVAGVPLAAFQDSQYSEGGFTQARRTASGPDGTWRLGGFTAGDVTLSPVLPPGSDIIALDKGLRTVQAGEEGIEIRVLALGSVEFTALVRATEGPVIDTIIAEPLDKDAGDPVESFPVIPLVRAKGRYLLRAAPGLRRFRLRSGTHGMVEATFRITAGQKGSREETVYFGGFASLTGTVRFDGRGMQAYVFLEKIGDAKGTALDKVTSLTGTFLFEGLEAGEYRAVVLRKGFDAYHTRLSVTQGSRADITLVRGGKSTPDKPRTYEERQGLTLSLVAEAFTLDDVAWWLSEVSQVPFSVSKDLRQRLSEQNRRVNLKVENLSLKNLVAILKRSQVMEFDEVQATFHLRAK